MGQEWSKGMKFWLVKLLFTTICFVGFYSVPNLIVIIFNLLYPVFIVGFHCKGCEIERVVWRLKYLKTEEGFAGISLLSIPRSISCALHMLKCEESGQMETVMSREYLVSKAFPWGTLFCQPVQSDTYFLCLHYLYPYYPQKWRELLRENPNQTTRELEIVYTYNSLHICFRNFLISYLSISIPLRGLLGSVLLNPIVWCYVWYYVWHDIWLNIVINKFVLLLSEIIVTWIFRHYHIVHEMHSMWFMWKVTKDINYKFFVNSEFSS